MASSAPSRVPADLAARAKTALDGGRAAEANTLYDQAIAAIGDSYRHEGTLDDTGMKLTLAASEERQGNLERAANIKAGVVESRLAQAKTPH